MRVSASSVTDPSDGVMYLETVDVALDDNHAGFCCEAHLHAPPKVEVTEPRHAPQQNVFLIIQCVDPGYRPEDDFRCDSAGPIVAGGITVL